MAERSPLERIAEWVSHEDDLTEDADGNIVVAGDMVITVDADEERLLLTHSSFEPGADPARVEALRSRLPGRATTMTGTVESADDGAFVRLDNPVYLDGLNHQTFSTALRELIGAVDALGLLAASGDLADAFADPGLGADPAPALPDQPEPTREMPPAWVATHAVPSGGMSAWPEPNPETQATAHLEARVRLSVAVRRGDWAKVIGSNGWTGWVDNRRLVELAKPETGAVVEPTGIAVGSTRVNPVILAGALFTALSALLPWVDDGRNAMELTLKFLWDVEASGTPYLGWGLMALGAMALGTAFLRKPLGPAVLVGIATVAVAVLFVAQVYRVLNDLGGGFEEVKNALGIAPALTLGGGILTLIGGTR